MMSEDDIRAKVVGQWLKDCGFNENEIHIEYSINIRLGRNTRTLHSRTDVLVTNSNKQPLLIVEVKKPSHALNEDDKKQALSYARLLETGIAPFTILTNGKDTKIYDSVTGQDVGGETIPSDHPYVSANFKVSGDGISCRAEALEYLISLSAENLLTFCKGQVAHRLGLLKSKDLKSGKKYIPQLYVSRKQAEERLSNLLNKKEEKIESNVTLVVGPPQHGKTCFMCHSVEKYLDDEVPCLFYPAISLRGGLLDAIKEDFEWGLGEQINAQEIVQRFNRIINKTNQQLLIFVDGWNEMLEDALYLNDECIRIVANRIQMIISTTSPSVQRLLIDHADNCTKIADTINLNRVAIRKLTVQPLQNTEGVAIIQIGSFSDDETQQAKHECKKAFQITFTDTSNQLNNPFYLRLACELNKEVVGDRELLGSNLLNESLIRKGARTGLSQIEVFSKLKQITDVILQKDTPFSAIDLPESFQNEEFLRQWKEAAILIQTNEKGIPHIDFYYSYERDYTIAIVNREWNKRIANMTREKLIEEFKLITETEACKEAFRWFLYEPEYFDSLKHIFECLDSTSNIPDFIIDLLSVAALNQVKKNTLVEFSWLQQQVEKLVSLKFQNKHHQDITTLIYALLLKIDRNSQSELFHFWLRMLIKYDEDIDYYSYESFVNTLFDVDEFDDWRPQATDPEIDVLLELYLDGDSDVASRSTEIIVRLFKNAALRRIPIFFREKSLETERLLSIMIHEQYNFYYGEWGCPGLFDSFGEKDQFLDEFKKQKKLWFPIMRFIDCESSIYDEIAELLDCVKRKCLKAGCNIENLEIEDGYPYFDSNQLEFDFPQA